MGCFVQGDIKLQGMFCPGWQISAGCFAQGGKSVLDVLSRVANICSMFCLVWSQKAWDVLSFIHQWLLECKRYNTSNRSLNNNTIVLNYTTDG